MSTERSKEPEDLTRSQTSSTIDLSNYSSGAANSVFNIFSSQENNTEQSVLFPLLRSFFVKLT